ncbi:MAG: RiPP maturation radical SAM C-methyltransferase [Endomicrobia bacterium]|nr:RiPP maturation radical SAM C-methyltransferase [Endomicrobiia bacterium]
MKNKNIDVCLINMPYAEVTEPSLALGLLKVALSDENISTKILYSNISFAEKIGLKNYQLIAYVGKGDDMLIWDWTFSQVAFPNMKRNDLSYLRKIYSSIKFYEHYPGELKTFIRSCLEVRKATKNFIEETAKAAIATGAKIIACTSTLRQHVSSIALLRKVKELDPSKITMIGGANCSADMGKETHRSFAWIDFLVSGEGEEIIGKLCKDILAYGTNLDIENLPFGVFGPKHREQNHYDKIGSKYYATVKNIDNSPIPDFTDYFDALNISSIKESVVPGIILLTSKGCWWGQKYQCSFCGLNGADICYRVKSPERALKEIKTLEIQYKTNRLLMADNILDMGYFNSLLPDLASDGKKRCIFYETKSNLSKQQVEMLKKSGVEWIEPGIESLHSDPLKFMNKGVKAWQNIQLLKWARQYGVRTYWNIMWNFPGEDDKWYLEMSKFVPMLEHLHPPARLAELLYHRYSDYYNNPEKYDITLIPHPALQYIYPLSQEQLKSLTYTFFVEKNSIFEKKENLANEKVGVSALRKAIRDWQSAFWIQTKPILNMVDNGNSIDIIDTRKSSCKKNFSIKGLSRYIYLLCDKAPLKESLSSLLKEQFHFEAKPKDVNECIDMLKENNLIIEIDERIISLAVQGEAMELPTWDETPFGIVKGISHV